MFHQITFFHVFLETTTHQYLPQYYYSKSGESSQNIAFKNLKARVESFDRSSMETTGGIIRCGALLGLLLLATLTRISALSVTVNDVECIYEYVLYEGDTVSGNFVVVDHDIFWSSDHPGIDFTVLILRFFVSPNFSVDLWNWIQLWEFRSRFWNLVLKERIFIHCCCSCSSIE